MMMMVIVKLIAVLVPVIQVAWQQTVIVSNKDGEDGPNCGVTVKPCRSIEFAIQNRVVQNATILLDNRYQDIYSINQTIEMNADIMLKPRYKHFPRPLIKTFIRFPSFSLFMFSSERYTLMLSDLHFDTLSLVVFYIDGDVVIENCLFDHPGTLLSSSSPLQISLTIISSNFTGWKESSLDYLLKVSDFQELRVLMVDCTLNETLGWSIHSPKDDQTRELNITLHKSRLTARRCAHPSTLANPTDLTIEMTSSTRAVIVLNGSHFINTRIHTSQVVVNSIGCRFEGGCSPGKPLLEIEWHQEERERITFWLSNCSFTNSLCGALSIRSCDRGYIMGCLFENNTQGLDHMGGAILSVDCGLFIDGSTFVNNSALNNGGTIASNSDVELQIKNTKIIGPYNRASLLGSILYCTYFISLDNVVINASLSHHSTNPYLIYAGLSQTEYGQNFTFYCPFNSDIKIENRVANEREKTKQTLVYCLPCPKDRYNLTQGSMFYRYTDRPDSLLKYHVKCASCPTSGICDGHIKTRDNYWGYSSKRQTLEFIRCPQYYCCSSYGKRCESLNTCNSYREGTLCGRCIEGYSQPFVGNQCVENHQCQVVLFWGLYGLVFILFLLAMLYVKDLLRLFCSRVGLIKDGVSNTQEGKMKERHLFSGTIKILFFFYQAEELLRVETSAKYQYRLPIFLHAIVSAVFNFQVPYNSNTLCPSAGSSIVEKEAIRVSIVALVFIILLFLYCTHLLLRKLQCIEDEPTYVVGFGKSFGVRIKSALLQLMLLGFSNFAIFSFRMVHCITIKDAKRLYVQGDVDCYTKWQITIITFIAVWIAPLPLVLCLSAHFLQEMKMPTNRFLMTLFFPPFSLVFYIFACRGKYRLTKKQKESAIFFLRHIYEPYRSVTPDRDNGKWKPLNNQIRNDANEHNNNADKIEEGGEREGEVTKYYLLGESQLLLRRLVLTIVYEVTIQPVIRMYILFLLMTVFLLTHLIMKPFGDRVLNTLETVSLTTLCSLTAINIFWAYTDEFDTLKNSELYTTGVVFVVLELMLLFLPVFLICLCGILFCLRRCFVCKICISKLD